MSNDTNNDFQNLFGKPKSADEFFIAGKSNPGYVPNDSDFSNNEARISFLAGLASGKQSGS